MWLKSTNLDFCRKSVSLTGNGWVLLKSLLRRSKCLTTKGQHKPDSMKILGLTEGSGATTPFWQENPWPLTGMVRPLQPHSIEKIRRSLTGNGQVPPNLILENPWP
ncbi:hypothetical protein AVEN_171987-1 [Araneus ventricosus]|uniref:Uncharacterized protein n=1 Tax=Araneus ventricosus TaxID=182803 RepID=A0A4Y2TQ62_ARAVE|nr:hypothetical protein AVEN_171987-1 [Araneus ventricosus]